MGEEPESIATTPRQSPPLRGAFGCSHESGNRTEKNVNAISPTAEIERLQKDLDKAVEVSRSRIAQISSEVLETNKHHQINSPVSATAENIRN